MQATVSSSMKQRVLATRAWQMGLGPKPPHADLRMLEKKRLAYLYRRPDGEVYAATLTHAGRQAAGLDALARPKGGWLMD